MDFQQKVKKALADGNPSEAVSILLTYKNLIGKDFEREALLLSAELNKWEKDFRLGLAPPQSTFNRINFALLEIIDKVETSNDLASFQTMEIEGYEVKFDSNALDKRSKLKFFNSEGIKNKPESVLTTGESNGDILYKMKADSSEFVGVTKAINALKGLVEIEYKALSSPIRESENLMFILIPMKLSSFSQKGYIEIGSDVQNSSHNPFSPYRKRFIIPRNHIGDSKWHKISLEFDFKYIPEAFYSVFAPRINEGALLKGPGSMIFKNVKIWGK